MRRHGTLSRLWRFGIKLAKWSVALVLLAAAGGWLWVRQDYADAAAQLPELEQQARDLGIPLTPAQMQPQPPVAPADNAAPLYLEAQKALPTSGLPKTYAQDISEWARIPEGRHDAELGQLLAKLKPAIDLAQRASKRPRCDFGRDWSQGPRLMFPEFAWVKNLAKLLQARGVLEARQGKVDEALADFDAVTRMAAHMGEERVLIGGLVTVAIDAIAEYGRSQAATYWAKNPAALAKLSRSFDGLPSPPSLQRMFQGEAFFSYYTSRHIDKFLVRTPPADDEDVPMMDDPLRNSWLLPPLFSQDMVCRAYASRALEFWVPTFESNNAKGWNPLQASDSMDMEARRFDISISHRPSDLLATILFPVFAQVGRAVLREQANREVISGLVDVLSFRAKNGRLPKTLKEAGVLASDPFTAAPLKYVVDGDTCRVYSVGPDGVDDGGLRYEDKARRRGPVRYGQDVVAFFPASDGYAPYKEPRESARPAVRPPVLPPSDE